MKKAAGDEAILARLIEDADIPDDALGFHAQQAVEKMLKAVLAWHAVPYERTHNLAYLVTLLEEAPDIAAPPDARSRHKNLRGMASLAIYMILAPLLGPDEAYGLAVG